MIIANSTQTQWELREIFGIEDNVRVVSHGIHPSFASQEAREIGLRKSPTVGCVAGLYPWKRISKAIRVIYFLRKLGFDSELIVWTASQSMGGRRALVRLSSELGVKSHVKFLHYVPSRNVPKLYREFDILIHPSAYEGFGYPILEAQACGTPVITFVDSKIPQEVKETTIQVDSEEDAARTMGHILSNQDQYKHLSRRSIENAHKFSLDKMISETLSVYNELLELGE